MKEDIFSRLGARLRGGADWGLEAGFDGNLHGLRGLLAVAVLVGHTGISDISSIAVWFFFVLSGYLLTQPYRHGMTAGQLGRYAVRRVARIYPLYFVVLVIIGILPSSFYAAVLHPDASVQLDAVTATLGEHLTFRRANMHFWTLSQEALGYVLIAALMMIRGRMANGLFVSLCLVLAAVFALFIGADALPMESDGSPRPFYATLFIIGVIAATLPKLPAPRTWCSAAALGILAAIFVAGLFAPQLCGMLHVKYWHSAIDAWVWGVIGALVVLGLANGVQALNALAFFGTLSYGIYVFHFLAMLIVAGKTANVQQTFFLVAIMTLPMAYLSWRYIEAPSIRLGQRLTRQAKAISPTAA